MRWMVLLTGLTALAAIVAFAAWRLAIPKQHEAINDESFAQIKDGMRRTDVERLLAGPPRIERTTPSQFVWDGKVPTESWGLRVIHPSFVSPTSEWELDEATKKQRAADQALRDQKNAEAAEDGRYLLCWHHDLTSISVIFDGVTDEVHGAILWKPREKTWREHPPFRWFR